LLKPSFPTSQGALFRCALGLVPHPVQYTFVRIMEGYWGVSEWAQRARFFLMKRNWERLARMREEVNHLDCSIDDLDRYAEKATGQSLAKIEEERQYLSSRSMELKRLTTNFPDSRPDIMPTRLGNVLRFYERGAGRPYDIDAFTVMLVLSRVAPSAAWW